MQRQEEHLTSQIRACESRISALEKSQATKHGKAMKEDAHKAAKRSGNIDSVVSNSLERFSTDLRKAMIAIEKSATEYMVSLSKYVNTLLKHYYRAQYVGPSLCSKCRYIPTPDVKRYIARFEVPQVLENPPRPPEIPDFKLGRTKTDRYEPCVDIAVSKVSLMCFIRNTVSYRSSIDCRA